MDYSGIRVEVSGGLANQIFMLLGGIWIADKSDSSLTLICMPNSRHSESLLDFDLPYKKVKSALLYGVALRALRKSSKFNSKLNRLIRKCGFYFTTEIGYPSNILPGTRIYYLSGYFQSHEIYNQALGGLSIFDLLNYSPSKWASDFIQNAIKSNDIAIHVRLGDYAQERDSIGLVGLSYYREGISRAIENGGTGIIRVITNDIEECKKYLEPLSYAFEYLTPPKNICNFDSLLILSNHQHLVLANSSFSLLAGLESKALTIVRPMPWFKNLPEPERLSPPEWIPIPSCWR